jgi:hypothetical protein
MQPVVYTIMRVVTSTELVLLVNTFNDLSIYSVPHPNKTSPFLAND